MKTFEANLSLLLHEFLLFLVLLLPLVRFGHDVVEPLQLVLSEHIIQRLSDEAHGEHLRSMIKTDQLIR